MKNGLARLSSILDVIMNSCNYKDIDQFITTLNTCGIPYLILRNWENFRSPELYVNGHGDIDLLCNNSRMLAEAIHAKSYTNKVKQICDDGVHYYITINNKHVSLDLRSIGDGYYCSKWQEDMLSRRIINEGFYVMSSEDYFFSLIHHAILQKRLFSDEYKERLQEMAKGQKILLPGITTQSFMHVLESFMMKNKYTYCYPTDTFVPLNTKHINKELLEKNAKLAFSHWIFDSKVTLIELLVKIKHLLVRH